MDYSKSLVAVPDMVMTLAICFGHRQNVQCHRNVPGDILNVDYSRASTLFNQKSQRQKTLRSI